MIASQASKALHTNESDHSDPPLCSQMCRADVQTCCFGLAASMGAFILGAGAKGKRSSMPNSRIMIHQPLGGASGQAVDMEIQAKEIMYHKANLNRIMSEYTGQPIEKVNLVQEMSPVLHIMILKRSLGPSLCLHGNTCLLPRVRLSVMCF